MKTKNSQIYWLCSRAGFLKWNLPIDNIDKFIILKHRMEYDLFVVNIPVGIFIENIGLSIIGLNIVFAEDTKHI